MRNALVLGNNAPAIPQVFLETARPLHTLAGDLSATLLVGTLTESRYFDTLTTNDHQSLSGVLVELRPAGAPNVTLGVARLVTRPVGSATSSLGHALDALVHWEAAPIPDSLDTTDRAPQADQLFSLFGRWVLPRSGFEVYGEWARTQPPRSITEVLVAPHHTQGYTLGAQWAVPTRAKGHHVKFQAEATYLEQSIVLGNRPAPSFYTGQATAHGFTQRGQVLGAAIGPGSSSQYFGADYVSPGWRAGMFVGRTRWDNDVLYVQPEANAARHDVTIYSGARASANTPLGSVAAEVSVGRRLNYLFQNDAYNAGEDLRSVDIQNVMVTFALTPELARRGR